MFSTPYFFVGCQHGAESKIKQWLTQPAGPFRLAFSRPGFVTFKSELSTPAWSTAVPSGTFIRTRGHAVSRFEGESADELVAKIIEQFRPLDWTDLHVWQRDVAMPGWNGFEPGRSALATLVADQFQSSLQELTDIRSHRVNQITDWKAKVLSVVIVEPNLWWVGTQVVETMADRWPGGVFPISEPVDMISRAYLKIAEAIHWSRIPMKPNDEVVEIGSSPGGACQYMLDLGLKVTGIDPAEMDEQITEHPDYTHIQSRSLQVKRKIFNKYRWLVCDANVAPSYTLQTVESIVTYPTSKFEGLILTMKLSDWDKADEVEQHVDRVRSWGFQEVMARQLSYNRREYCLAALR